MKHILTGAIIGAILGLLIAVPTGIGEVTATGVNEVAEASAVIGALAGATLGHSLINYRANRKVKIMAKHNAKAKIEAERRAREAKRRAKAEHQAKAVKRRAEAERQAIAEAERKAMVEAAERKAKIKADERKAKEAKRRAERKAKEAERKAKAAERKAKAAERKAKAVAKRKATIAAKRKAIAKIEAAIKAANEAATMDERRVESGAASEDERIASQIEVARTRAIEAAIEAINIGKSMNKRVSANVIRDARLAIKATETTSKAVPITYIDTKLIAHTVIDAIEAAIKTEFNTEDAVKAIIKTPTATPIKAAIKAANEAAIMDARIARSTAASNDEHTASTAIEDACIAASHTASEYKRSGAVEAAWIAAIEDAGTRAIQAANQAAIIGKGMSKSENTSVIRSARLASIKAAISTASDGIGDDARIDKIATEIENARTQKIENARAIANAGKNARIATVDTDVVARAIKEARTDAIKDIIANANTRYARMVAIEATAAIAIIDIIEAAIETDAAEDGIKSIMEVKIPSAIKEASRAARVYAKPAGLNVPVDNYKDLPKLNAPAGYVYVIQDMSHSQQYKIGRTNHPASRLNRFGVALPIKTEVIAILRTDNAPTLERRLHQKFASSQTEGEWFALDAAQIDEIRRM